MVNELTSASPTISEDGYPQRLQSLGTNEDFRVRRRRIRGRAWDRGAFTLLATALLTAGCSTNPATGRKQLDLIGPEDEIRIGSQAAPKFLEQYGGELPSAAVNSYVGEIGHRLARYGERPDLPWAFHVVDSKVLNAFALPDGKVFISRGLLGKLQNEAQLAGVLSHEIGHVTGKHINDRMGHALGVQVLAMSVGVAAGASDEDWLRGLGVGTHVGGTLYLLSFSRDQETEADELGLRYMSRADYNPVGLLQLMRILKRESVKSVGGGLEFLSTHPLAQTRIDDLDELIRRDYPAARHPGKYRFYRDRFHRKVLSELAKLPPPAHPPEKPRDD